MNLQQTINYIRKGELAIENDGTVEQLYDAIKVCFPCSLEKYKDMFKYYRAHTFDTSLCVGVDKTFSKSIKVTEFLTLK